MKQTEQSYHSCRICGSSALDLIRESRIPEKLSSEHFNITNSDYGITGELRKCRQCGFIQCTDLEKVLNYYIDLQDPEYEKERDKRLLQERRLVMSLKRIRPEGTLLDVGAGSGMLVEAAIELGYKAKGIEPSKWLCDVAQKHNLPVYQGTFPHPETPGPYDIITLIDVLEHVTNPLPLLTDVKKALKKDGILLVVVPDVRSFFARILKYRWWHFRLAHIGYFNKENLAILAQKAGLQRIKQKRPTWYFSAGYLAARMVLFLPRFMRFNIPRRLERWTIPVNLRDSILAIYRPDNYV